MNRAWNLTRTEIHYRHDAFSAGLRAAGFDVQKGQPGDVKPGEVVLGWNRYEPNHTLALRVEKAGGIYVAAENGYLGPGGISPHSMNPRQWFALSRYAHNDSTRIPEGDGSRWSALGVTLQPWRASGSHILVAPGRSFGTPGRIQPPGWPQDVAARLAKLTKREIRVRPHPGNNPPAKPLADDLAGAHAMVIWSSSAGVHSLAQGIPVFVESPFWIMKGCEAGADIERPAMPDRLPHFQRLAWAQWSIDAIAVGEPFRMLLA